MSWLYSQALVEAYLGGGCSDGEQFAPLNVMPTLHKFWRNDKMMDHSKHSQFGLTFAVLTESRGEELLTLYRADSLAKTLARQEKAQESMASAAECGKKWHGLLAKYDQATHSWKTAQCSLLEDLELSLQTWPRWGSMRNGACYLQPMLAHLTLEREFGLLPKNETFFHTPKTTGLDGGSNSRKALKKRLKAETPSGNWPTPTCSDVMTDKLKSTQQTAGSMHSVSLAQAVQMWPTRDANMGARGSQPEWTAKRASGHTAQYSINQAVRDSYETPTARMWKDNGKSPSELDRNSETLAMQAGGSLNPPWVEWLMGWPIGWTDLKPLATDKCHFVQQPHLNYLNQGLDNHE
jgi:hypothetical protein